MKHWVRNGAYLVLASGVAFAVLFFAISHKPLKRFDAFDQWFYLIAAYDLKTHGVFSNGYFDEVDSTEQVPPPGMFLGPVFPGIIAGAMAVSLRFDQAVSCAVEARHNKTNIANCDPYATPVHLISCAFLTLGLISIAIAAHVLFLKSSVTLLTSGLVLSGLLAEAEMFSFIMTEGVTFGLYCLAALFLLRALKWRGRYDWLAAGLCVGLLTLTRPSYLLLFPLGVALAVAASFVCPRRGTLIQTVPIFSLGFLIIVSPWVLRNYVALGKIGLSEEYGASALIERFSYNSMTLAEGSASLLYCVPRLGPSLLKRIPGASRAVSRFEWTNPDGFFAKGKDQRHYLLQQHGRLDPILYGLVREEMRANWWRFALATIPLAWCGLWIGKTWSLLVLPIFAVSVATAIQKRVWLFIGYSVPPLMFVFVHGAVANHYTRYNLPLIGPAAIGAAWILIGIAKRKIPGVT